MSHEVKLRLYRECDEEAVLDLWLRAWKASNRGIDFDERLKKFRYMWRNEIVPPAVVMIAEIGGVMVGVVTIDQNTHYLDQIFVAPEMWGQGVSEALLMEAKRLAPIEIELKVNAENGRAIRFYKRHGFANVGSEENSSGRPVYIMYWRSKKSPL